MSLIITETPLKVVNEDIPENSKWSAVWHPTIWKFQRQDFQLTAISYGGGSPAGIDLTATGDFTAEVSIGDTVFVNASNGEIYGTYEVLDVQFSGGGTIITIDSADLGSYTVNGYLNFVTTRTYYKIEIAVYGYANEVKELLTTYYGEYRPNIEGTVKVDLQRFLQALVNANDEYQYLDRSKAAPYLGARYDIQVREYWKEAGFGAWNDGTDLSGGDMDKHFIVHAVKKIGDYWGQNMAEFVMFPTDQGSPQVEHNKGKFLSKFEEPTYFVGYPFDLSFLYDHSIDDAGQRLAIVEELYDVNDQLLDTNEYPLDNTNSYLTRCTIDPVFSGNEYPSTVHKVKFYLKAQVLTASADASVVWSIDMVGMSNIQLIDFDSGVTIGNANWAGSLSQLLDDLVTSVNTNTQSGALINGAYPFDNSVGYTATKTASGGPYVWDLTVNAPAGSGAAYNGVQVGFINDTGAWFVDPATGGPAGSFAQDMAGGDDGGFVDEPGLTTARVSEIKTILVDAECYDNPVYLKWLNPYGGYEYWLFHTRQQYTDGISDEQIFERYIEDLASATAREETLSKQAIEEINIGAELLTKQQKEGLRYLLRSPKVYMLLDAELNIWQTVRIKGGTFDINDTFESKERIELTILLPKPYNQQQ